MTERSVEYKLGETAFVVCYADLTKIDADVLVSSDDNYLTQGGGISRALAEAGGNAIASDARKHLPLKQGDVAVTTAGMLSAKFIFHGATIDLERMRDPDDECIETITSRCLELAEALRVRHLAFPALGTGVGGFPFERAAEMMVRRIADHLSREANVRRVTLALWAREAVTEGDLNVFYERASSLAALSTQTRRLTRLLDELSTLVGRTASPQMRAELDELRRELRKAQENLDESPGDRSRIDELEESSGLAKVGRQAVEMAKMGQIDIGWRDHQVEAAALRTRIEGLSTQLNIHYSSLNRLEIDEAKYGGIGVPIILQHQIEQVRADAASVEKNLRETRRQLATLVGEHELR